MENKRTITELKKGQEPTLLHTWKGNELIKALNKQWVVVLPDNCGTATFKDSDSKVTLDFSNVNFANATTFGIETQNDGGYEGVAKAASKDEVTGLVTLAFRSLHGTNGVTTSLSGDNVIEIAGSGSAVVVSSTPLIVVTPTTVDGVTTYTITWAGGTDMVGCPDDEIEVLIPVP